MARRALVTGGNRGIGRAIAAGLLETGLEVVIAARRAAEGEAVAGELGCASVKLDLDDPRDIAPALEAAGRVDVLVNNAGVLWDRPMIDHPEDFRRSMQVMVAAPYALIRGVVPGMTERGYGRIVNVSSGWGAFDEGLEGPGAYGVAKAALNALTLALSREVSTDILVNAMCPGWVRTRMGGTRARRSPEEGAETAVWLATLPEGGPTGGFFRDRKPIAW
jgi:NAD(P)-dependent dehydrogenase (short-subunit alcohol dehydrogenase family)